MSKIFDRIKEASYTTGTGDFSLSFTVDGFSSFGSRYSNGDQLFYTASDGNNYEVGLGTYNSGPNTVSRNEVYQSSNSDNLVNFGNGIKEIYVVYPAKKSVYQQPLEIPNSGELAYWYNENIVASTSGVRYRNSNLEVDNNLIVNGLASGEQFIVNNNIAFDSLPLSPQTQPFISNLLLGETRIDEVLELSGNLNNNIGLKMQPANHVFAGPVSGCVSTCGSDYPSFRLLDTSDIPPILAENVLYTPGDSGHWTTQPTNAQEGFDYLADNVFNIEDLFPDALPASGGNADTLDFLDSTDFSLVEHNHEKLVYARVVEDLREFNQAMDSFDVIYNISDNNVYVYNVNSGEFLIDLGRSVSELGLEKFVFNNETDKLYYIKTANDVRNVSSKVDNIRDVANGVEITNWIYNSGEFSGSGYFYDTRSGSVKINTDGMVGITIADRATTYDDPGQIGDSNNIYETNGLEQNGALPRKMYAFRRNGNDIHIDVNSSGVVRSLLLGTVT